MSRVSRQLLEFFQFHQHRGISFEQYQHEQFLLDVGKVEEKLNIKTLPPRQQPYDISELTDEQHDELVLYKLHDEEIKKKICTQLRNQIATIVDSMGSFAPENDKAKIKENEHNNGSYTALKRLLILGAVRKLNAGWSRQLLQVVTTMGFKVVEELIKLKQIDLDDFNKRPGIPRNNILVQITEKLQSYGSTLVSPVGRNDENNQDVPVVHPKLFLSEDHFTKNTTFTDGTYWPRAVKTQILHHYLRESSRISFNDVIKTNEDATETLRPQKYKVLLRKHHGLFLFLIGPAGSGKTTLTKRMVKEWIDEKKVAFLIPFAQINGNQRLRLKNLLTQFLCQLHNVEHDPSEEEIDEAFYWILVNQDKCLLVFDGLDQAGFNISEKLIKADINDELKPCDLLALIFSRQFLPEIRLVVSSRPHSKANFSPVTRPQIVVLVDNLIGKDVEKLMNHYSKQAVASETKRKIWMASPRIRHLTVNPLFLRLVVMLENEVGEDVWSYVNTTAKLFFEVIRRLQTSAHHEYGLVEEDVNILNGKLGRMAFDKIMQRSVVFTQADLDRYGLIGNNVLGFLFGVIQNSSQHKTAALLVGRMEVFHFNHQSTQEFFSAKFALEKLTVDEFKDFVGKLFPRITRRSNGDVQVGEDIFANLRMLVIECANELKLPVSDQVLEKKKIFIKSLCNYLRQIFVKTSFFTANENHRNRILTDLLDFKDEDDKREIREQLKDFNFWIHIIRSAGEGLSYFLQHFTSKIEFLKLNIGGRSERLFQAIHKSTVKVETMWILTNSRYLPRISIGNVVATFPHLTAKLTVAIFNSYPGNVRGEFCRNLEEAINNFDTSLLQTEKLEVGVSYNYGRDYCLQVVITRGQPLQFIKSDYKLSD